MARPKSFDPDLALDRAVELFWEHGYEGTSLAALEAHLGIGRQSLYNSFGDKHQLYLKALERYAGWSRERSAEALLAPDAGLAEVREYLEGVVQFLTTPGPRRACFLSNALLEVGGDDRQARQRCTAALDVTLRGLRHALGNAVRTGELPRRFDVETAALTLATQMYGLSVLAKTGASPDAMRRAAEGALAVLR